MANRILLYFHTASGNTGWITSQIAGQLRDHGFEIVTRNLAYDHDFSDAEQFEVIGFGCPVMGFRPTFAMTDFIDSLPVQQEKPAFIYVTCAGISASSLWMLSQLLHRKGLVVIAAQQFKAEVSWPVARLPGIIPDKGRPDARDIPAIQRFTGILSDSLQSCDEKRPVTPLAIPFPFLNPFSYMGRANKVRYLRSIMGTMRVIEARCSQCGKCQKYCASNAISLNPYPQFSSSCTGCWGCYNICPEAAISTFTGTGGRYTSRAAYLDVTDTGSKT